MLPTLWPSSAPQSAPAPANQASKIPRVAVATPGPTRLKLQPLVLSNQRPLLTSSSAGHPSAVSPTAAPASAPHPLGALRPPSPAAFPRGAPNIVRGQAPAPVTPLHRPPVPCSPLKGARASESGRPNLQQLAACLLDPIAVMQTAITQPQVRQPPPSQGSPCPVTTAPRVEPLPSHKAGSGTVAPTQNALVSGVRPLPCTTAPGVLPPPAPEGTSTRQPPASRDPRLSTATASRESKQKAAKPVDRPAGSPVSFVRSCSSVDVCC